MKSLVLGLIGDWSKICKDNIWKSHKFLKSVILDRGSQFATKLIKKLNEMLDIETKLSTVFYSQTDR